VPHNYLIVAFIVIYCIYITKLLLVEQWVNHAMFLVSCIPKVLRNERCEEDHTIKYFIKMIVIWRIYWLLKFGQFFKMYFYTHPSILIISSAFCAEHVCTGQSDAGFCRSHLSLITRDTPKVWLKLWFCQMSMINGSLLLFIIPRVQYDRFSL